MTHQEAIDTLAAERYLLDEMSRDERNAFEDHFFGCDACAGDMRAAASMAQGARVGFAGGAAAAPLRHPAWYRSALIPWAAAATLALVAGYQAAVLVPSLRRTAPLALTPVTLHPASRGAEAIVPIDRAGGAVTLAIDGIESDKKTVLWTLTTSEGRTVTSGEALTPAPGAPVLLLMPAWTLTDAMHYILAFRDAADAGRSLGEYRFAVSPR